MWDQLSLPWQACFEEVWAAYCDGSVPIGAVVTDSTGVLLARGRNRVNLHAAEGGYLFGQPLAHAEINALVVLNSGEVDRHTCTLYTTSEPCPLCLGAIYMSGVRQLCYACRDPFAGSVDLLGSTPYLSRKPVKVLGPQNPDFENLLMGMAVDHHLQDRQADPPDLLETWRVVLPQGVAFGESLHQSKSLREMNAAGFPASEVYTRLATMVMS